MEPSFRIEFTAYFVLALGLLILPPDWLCGMILAMAIHELFHYGAAKLLNVNCLGMQIGAGEIRMEMAPMSRWEELIIAAAGPAGSFLLLMFASVYPQLTVSAGVQGIFNLLPIWPLDGGRILRCVFYRKDKLCNAIEFGTIVLILGLGIFLQIHYNMGYWPIVFAGIISGKALRRKIPCKPTKLGVQ